MRPNEIVRKHMLWLNGEPGGERADLEGVNLYGVTFGISELPYSNFKDANLIKARLDNSNFDHADLENVNLTAASLFDATIRHANLKGANLRYANLECVDFTGSDLSGADFTRANITDVIFTGANLTDVKGLPRIVCPETGSFIGYKLAYTHVKTGSDVPVIIKLEIPEDALRLSSTGRECRCSKAKVLEITTIRKPHVPVEVCHSSEDREFTYKVGETVEVPDFDNNRWSLYSPGIYFFLTRKEVKRYYDEMHLIDLIDRYKCGDIRS